MGLNSPFGLRSKRVVTPQGMREATVLINDGRIHEVRNFDHVPAAWPLDDVGLAVVMPGLVDTHVHINEPGRTEWEGFETATKAAAAGGITTLVDMPLNSSPVTATVEALEKKLDAAKGKLWVDCGFYGGVIPGNAHHLQSLIDAGVLGFKAFLIHSGIDEFPNVSEADLRSAMPIIAKNNLPLLVHCELQTNSIHPTIHPSDQSRYRAYLSSRPRQWEHEAIKLVIRLCREYNCRTHIVHLSSADAIPMIQQARSDGLPFTLETCPHYLYFDAEEIPEGDTRFKCAPPIRERENRERLWEGLRNGTIDFIASDHSPSTPGMKCLNTGNFLKAWGGISSLQFGISIVWAEAQRRGFTIVDVAQWMSARPAHLIGLESRKGAIAAGFDADIVVWNPDSSFVVGESMIHHRHKLTPYQGRALQGVVERTYLRGQMIYDGKTFAPQPSGKVLLNRGN
jgi:allantoinase